jgi:hypothetical protein
MLTCTKTTQGICCCFYHFSAEVNLPVLRWQEICPLEVMELVELEEVEMEDLEQFLWVIKHAWRIRVTRERTVVWKRDKLWEMLNHITVQVEALETSSWNHFQSLEHHKTPWEAMRGKKAQEIEMLIELEGWSQPKDSIPSQRILIK